MKLLQGKLAVVSGVRGGIGLAIATLFVEHGASVIGVDLAPSDPDQPPGSAPLLAYVAGDISAEQTIQQITRVVTQTGADLEILVNNAAILGPTGALEIASVADWRRVLDVNLMSVAQLTSVLVPFMRCSAGARIINVGSLNSILASQGSAPYVASKHAVLGLTRVQAVEYGRLGITANCLLPGAVDTEMFRQGDPTGEFRRYMESRCPLRRMARPEEIAGVALFMASEYSSYMNGHALVVDGGVAARI